MAEEKKEWYIGETQEERKKEKRQTNRKNKPTNKQKIHRMSTQKKNK